MSLSLARKSVGSSSANRTVLIPIDGSIQSKYAFDWYINNMKQENDMVIFIHVIEPFVSTPLAGLSDLSSHIETGDRCRVTEDSLQYGRLLCQEVIREANKYGLKTRAFLSIDSRPEHALMKSIEEEKVDVVVMANRGIGKLRSTFLGSTSAYMLHHARIPVAIVPPVRKSSL